LACLQSGHRAGRTPRDVQLPDLGSITAHHSARTASTCCCTRLYPAYSQAGSVASASASNHCGSERNSHNLLPCSLLSGRRHSSVDQTLKPPISAEGRNKCLCSVLAVRGKAMRPRGVLYQPGPTDNRPVIHTRHTWIFRRIARPAHAGSGFCVLAVGPLRRVGRHCPDARGRHRPCLSRARFSRRFIPPELGQKRFVPSGNPNRR
jgi:hypothetical protein